MLNIHFRVHNIKKTLSNFMKSCTGFQHDKIQYTTSTVLHKYTRICKTLGVASKHST